MHQLPQMLMMTLSTCCLYKTQGASSGWSEQADRHVITVYLVFALLQLRLQHLQAVL